MSKTEKIWLSVMLGIVLAIALVSATDDIVLVTPVCMFYGASASMFLSAD